MFRINFWLSRRLLSIRRLLRTWHSHKHPRSLDSGAMSEPTRFMVRIRLTSNFLRDLKTKTDCRSWLCEWSRVGEVHRKVPRSQRSDEECDGKGKHKRKLRCNSSYVGQCVAGHISLINHTKRQLCVGHRWSPAIGHRFYREKSKFVSWMNILFLHPSPKQTESPQHTSVANNNNTIVNDHKTVSSNSSTEGMTGSEQQLKYENERLKLALAQR